MDFKINELYENRSAHKLRYLGDNLFEMVDGSVYKTDDIGHGPRRWQDVVEKWEEPISEKELCELARTHAREEKNSN